jgi:hypothetical protein
MARPRDRLLLPSLGTGEPTPLPRLSDPVSRRVPSGRGWGWGLLRHQAVALQLALTAKKIATGRFSVVAATGLVVGTTLARSRTG